MFDQRPLGVMTVRLLGFLHCGIYKERDKALFKLCSSKESLLKDHRHRGAWISRNSVWLVTALLQTLYKVFVRFITSALKNSRRLTWCTNEHTTFNYWSKQIRLRRIPVWNWVIHCVLCSFGTTVTSEQSKLSTRESPVDCDLERLTDKQENLFKEIF